ncbi:hypothetical protein CYMTET_34433 [Cymbomonas tetramitiformis]|uniref:Uncharacterized protein n=1 Tax=Cymbomonas tetramitiformis TaxID=36881 RepID=A0AAE0FB27_9CHLO|nr:hypothetical protein CYMTET_34433 [Cymbomonas tetramitiformis]
MEVESYKARHRKTFSKAGDKPVEANSAPEWAPVEREKEMRLPRLADTVRLTAMMANVTQQEAFREKYPDIHEDELCLKWLNEDWRPSEDSQGGLPEGQKESCSSQEASTIASAFRNHVLPVFGAPAECFVDGERVVRTSKLCFKKMALDKGIDHEWDELLWSLVLSYNAAKQQSTGVAPFTLL